MCFVNVIASPEAVTPLIWSNFLEGWTCSTVCSMLIGLFIKRPEADHSGWRYSWASYTMFINSSPVNKLDSPHRRGFNVRNGKDLPIVWELLVSGVYVLSTRRTLGRHRSSLYHNVDHVWVLTAKSWSWSAPFMDLSRLSVPALLWLCLLVNLVINGTLQPLSGSNAIIVSCYCQVACSRSLVWQCLDFLRG